MIVLIKNNLQLTYKELKFNKTISIFFQNLNTIVDESIRIPHSIEIDVNKIITSFYKLITDVDIIICQYPTLFTFLL